MSDCTLAATNIKTSPLLDKYEWILFDADETLFTFDSFLGLSRMFSNYGVEFTRDHFSEYMIKNKLLWTGFQNGTVTAQQLKSERFTVWSQKIGHPPELLNSAFLSEMLEISSTMVGAIGLLDYLKGKVKLGIITNGFIELQQSRLERHKLHEYFDLVLVSESIGIAKPDRRIFEHALTLMGNPENSQVLMVGDSLESDILGGINIGFDTCLVNHGLPAHENIKPNFEFRNLAELQAALSTNRKPNEGL